jgi:hypothetical protein
MIPLLIVGVLGFFLLLSFPFNIPPVTKVATDISQWAVIITSFALGLGVINMLFVHARKVQKRDKLWPYSSLLIISLLGVAALGLITGVSSTIYTYTYNVMVQAGMLTLISLRGFFMFTAFYRAYRVRSIDGTVMLIGSILVMTYQVPIQELISPLLPDLTIWLLNVPSVGGYRAIAMIAGVGLIIMALRQLSGLDRSWLGAEQ